jgi:hypothetical protein
MDNTENKMCPSSVCREGSLLLGVVQGDKTVTLLSTPIMTNKAFIEKVQAQGEPEKRFRFANKCVKSGCRQWDGSSCGVMNKLSAANPHLEEESVLRPCFIRDSCRWFHQEGKNACAICVFVVTNNMEETEG